MSKELAKKVEKNTEKNVGRKKKSLGKKIVLFKENKDKEKAKIVLPTK